MSFFARFRAFLASFRDRLTHLSEDESMSRFSIALVLLLDAFLVSLLFSGLADHTAQLARPESVVSDQCRSISADLQDARRLGNPALPAASSDIAGRSRARDATSLASGLRSPLSSTSYPDRSSYSEDGEWAVPSSEVDPACADIERALVTARESVTVQRAIQSLSAIAYQKEKLEGEIRELRSSYDSALLERVAGQSSDDSILPTSAATIKDDLDAKQSEISRLDADRETQSLALLRESVVTDLQTRLVVRDGDDFSGRVQDRYDRLAFWFPLREFGMQMLFLLPLLLLAGWWQRASVRRASRVQTLIASHLLFVALIPVVFRVGNLVIDLIPHRLLAEIFEFFALFHLVGVWYYLVGFIAVVVTVWVVRFAERRFFSAARLAAKRLGRGECVRCGRRMPMGETCAHCPSCGVARYEPCASCGASSLALAPRCQACGAEKTKAE